jgi:hypothetical protein
LLTRKERDNNDTDIANDDNDDNDDDDNHDVNKHLQVHRSSPAAATPAPPATPMEAPMTHFSLSITFFCYFSIATIDNKQRSARHTPHL